MTSNGCTANLSPIAPSAPLSAAGGRRAGPQALDPRRDLFQRLAEIQFESGYPYIMFEDTVNRASPVAGRVTMSNLCSEILQVSTPSAYNEDLSYAHIGKISPATSAR
ncbi:ribonucleotide reductase of class Ib (aerobic) subunit alpha [Klebsiella pneumoniae]|uniref:Ribonucleotide reductase of class Ib (Aerobic) subunit alpha n=1 Tax=Klebsiella pneumoniae TaxID=573 RepID=A0A377XR35_KLEPN|nr:ribonucleotide reductase of class Ib (aerobic) subunit alpha [Klebsiella pneumoniae]